MDAIQADMGGTNLINPLELAISKKLDSHYQRLLFILTDGEVRHVT